jgi:heme/copper-type cytochrome/quinol oxidase subunit 2
MQIVVQAMNESDYNDWVNAQLAAQKAAGASP